MALFALALHIRRRRQPKKRFRQKIPLMARRRRSYHLTRRCLLPPSTSAFSFLYGSGCDRSLITMTGFDHKAFRYILERFEPVYAKYTPYSADGHIRVLPLYAAKRGRPRSLTSAACLGLVLAWGRTRGSESVLCMLFGITAAVCSIFLRFGRRILLRVLSKDSNASIRMPSLVDVHAFQQAFAAKYSMLHEVYAVADGLKLYLEQSGNTLIQNMFYNGWTHDHYVSNVFVFAPNGTILACAINAPGAMHDSTIADWGGIYEKLQKSYDDHGGLCVVDSAFCRTSFPFLIKSSQDFITGAEGGDAIILGKQATSARQAAEWGMRAFKQSFPRMKDRFLYEERGERKYMLLSTALLYNIRTRLVGINQLLSTYMPNFSVEAEEFFV